MNLPSPLSFQDNGRRDSAWARAASYEKEERPMRAVRKIVVKGAVDVVFFRAPVAQLVVAGDNLEAIRDTKTRFESSKLIIEREGVCISGSGGSIHVAGGTIHVGGRRGGVTMQFNGPVGSVVVGQGHAVVGIALPEAPSIRIKGSGDVTLYDLQQRMLEVSIKGSGDITAFGEVEHLDAEVAGSGDVDVSELVAMSAGLSVSGSGEIDAFVSQSVSARVTGSGDIKVRGNPSIRGRSVTGSGSIKVK